MVPIHHNSNSEEPVSNPALTTQGRILRAASSEFARLGLAGARVDQIARAAGINKAMIYYHFTSKENLYRAVFRHHIETISDRLKRHLVQPVAVEARLESAAEMYASMMTEMDEFRSLMIRELAQPKTDLLDQLASLWRDSGAPEMLLQTLNTETEAGRFRSINVRQALVSFITMNIGYLFLAPMLDRILQVSDRNQFMNERKKAIVDLFLYGVKAR